jgi:hypothetical protein
MTQPRRPSEHIATRPTWDCRACDEPWPCPTAKAELLDEFTNYPSVLTIFMAAQMHVAQDDFVATSGAPPADLFERFMMWIRPARPT